MSALDHMKFAQVGYIVKDIESTKESYAKLLGAPVPPSQPCGYGAAKTVYKGVPAPDSHCKLAFFDLTPGVQLELIEPDEGPSTWREYLDTHGEGIHHIAFCVDNAANALNEMADKGVRLIDKTPRAGAEGLQIGFLHPKSTGGVLTELCEDPTK